MPRQRPQAVIDICIHVPIPAAMVVEIDQFIAAQEYPPSRVEVCRVALKEYLAARVAKTEKHADE